MGRLRILSGDFRAGRAEFDNLSLTLRGPNGPEAVPLSEIAETKRVGRETRVDGAGTVKTAAAGSLLGGLAAGAMAGGITGPAGAVLGAIAGAVITGRKIYPIVSVRLHDGRFFVAVARETEWAVFYATLRRAPPRRPSVPMIDVSPASPETGRESLLGGLRRRLPKLPKP